MRRGARELTPAGISSNLSRASSVRIMLAVSCLNASTARASFAESEPCLAEMLFESLQVRLSKGVPCSVPGIVVGPLGWLGTFRGAHAAAPCRMEVTVAPPAMIVSSLSEIACISGASRSVDRLM